MSAAGAPIDADGGTEAPLLELSEVVAGYGRSTVLSSVTLQVAPSTVVALLGANGAGKTTLLRVAAGLLRPRHGTVSLSGADITDLPPHQRARRGVCLIPEGRGIFRSLSVRENLELQIPPWIATTDISPALAAFPALGNRLGQVAGTLSGGQQQMVALARAYLAEPRVVLLDEVSMGLAPIVVDQIFASLQALAATGCALVIVEQYVTRALEMADTAYLLDRGSIVYGGPADALDETTMAGTYLGADTTPVPAATSPTAGDPITRTPRKDQS